MNYIIVKRHAKTTDVMDVTYAVVIGWLGLDGRDELTARGCSYRTMDGVTTIDLPKGTTVDRSYEIFFDDSALADRKVRHRGGLFRLPDGTELFFQTNEENGRITVRILPKDNAT